MMKAIFIISFLLLAKVFQGQQLIGHVFDSISKIPISFASVGLIKANRGTTANVDGRFEIDYPVDAQKDTLLISCVGYQTLKLPVENNTRTLGVLLSRNPSVLNEIFIRKYYKTILLPWKGKRQTSSLFTTDVNSHIQVARLLEVPVEFAKLESVTVSTTKRRKESRFRIRIYDYDSIKNKPGIELCDSVIEAYGKGIITINLHNYKIILPNKRFFIAVQWLFIPDNVEGKASNENGGTHDYFGPGIQMVRLADKGDSWFLYNNGFWTRWEYDMCLSATVSY